MDVKGMNGFAGEISGARLIKNDLKAENSGLKPSGEGGSLIGPMETDLTDPKVNHMGEVGESMITSAGHEIRYDYGSDGVFDFYEFVDMMDSYKADFEKRRAEKESNKGQD